ncbi:DUF4291 family protein [Amycolatopsis sp. NPDC051045]|uniref:DUF4291 family protein n=1 Tax=Amycolatopsis sp. NPDC051045 TaxID=3156922 RepID=UPI003414203C
MFEEKRVPDRQVRAAQTETTVRVYQTCSPSVADAAKERFKPPFERDGATWIVPSFRLAAYESGNGSKLGQERVLAIDLTRDGFEQALSPSTGGPARIEWEAERDLDHTPLNFAAIRIGLSSEAAGHYVDEWITAITDVTPVVRDIAGLLATDQLHKAVKLVPHEPPYPLGADLAKVIGATP